jgi:protein TonB
MKIKFILVIIALLGSGPSFGAGEASAQSNAPAAAKASPAAYASPAAKAKPKSKAKPRAKTRKKTVPKAKKPDHASADTGVAEAPDADPAEVAAATDLYKKELAESIVKASPSKVYVERPQALLRSVVVLEFLVAADGKLLKSAVKRSNRDRVTEATALASLRHLGPLPKPPVILVRRGPVKLHETWLFNTDGRFQVRSTALQQLDH